MKFLIVAALVAVAAAAPQQLFAYKQQASAQAFQAQPFTAQAFQAQPFTAQAFQAQPYQAQPFAYNKPAIVATITKTVTKPVTFQVPVATITKSSQPAPAQVASQPLEVSQYSAQPQYNAQGQYYTGAKQIPQPFVQIIKLEKNLEPSGDYSYFYQAENGIQASEKAIIKPIRDEKNEEHYVPNVEGSYSYTGPDGVQYTVNYVADEYGFRASGAHLPVPPAIPEEIQHSLQLNAKQQPAQKFN